MHSTIRRDWFAVAVATVALVGMLGFGSVVSATEIPFEPEVIPEIPVVVVAAEAEITAPANEGDDVSGEYTFKAVFTDNDENANDIEWFIASGACDDEGYVQVGNVDSEYTPEFSFVNGEFSVSLDLTYWDGGDYCFVFDPVEDGEESDVYAQRNFVVTQLYMIDGYKYEDMNQNGQLDEEDSTVADWEIKVSNPDTLAEFTTTTDDEGYYQIFVPAGQWVVSEETSRGWAQIRAYQGYGMKLRFVEESESTEIPTTCVFWFEGYEEFSRGPWSEATCSFLNERTPVTGGTRSGGGSSKGQVLGVSTTTVATTTEPVADMIKAPMCEVYLSDYLRMGKDNNPEQVKKLQIFLNAVGITVSITGEFDTATDAAVREFQKKYMTDILAPWGITDATGYVYRTTRAKINNMLCPGSEPTPEIQA